MVLDEPGQERTILFINIILIYEYTSFSDKTGIIGGANCYEIK